jgi:pyruvate,water dikinase
MLAPHVNHLVLGKALIASNELAGIDPAKRWIVPQSRVMGSSVDEIGGKAVGLVQLVAAGTTVPPFFVVPVVAFRSHLRCPTTLQAIGELTLWLADGNVASAGDACEVLQRSIRQTPLDSELRAAMDAELLALGDSPVSVRSSMVGEDAAEHSFAGQLHTSLWLTGPDDVAAALLDCWASAFSPSVVTYALRAGMAIAEIRVGVIVQRMVEAEVAGVAFSADPVTGARDHCLVTAAYGLGEGAVGDLAPTDEYRWAPAEGEQSATVADKDVGVFPVAEGSGTEVRSVPVSRRAKRALTPDQVTAVGELVRRIADQLGVPVDLEWCWSAGSLYALQARPVTSLPPDPDSRGHQRVFDNANIQESFNGVTTPLTFSFASRLYESVYGELLRRFDIRPDVRTSFAPVLRNLLALIDGRIYYNLDSWRQMIELMPSGKRRIAEVESIMFRTMIGSSTPEQLSPRQRLRWLVERSRQIVKFVWYLLREDAEVDSYIDRFEHYIAGIDRENLAGRSLDELEGMILGFWAKAAVPAAMAYFNDVRVAIASGRVRQRLEKVHPPREVDSALATIMGGVSGLESIAPTVALMEIARDVRASPELAAKVSSAPPGERVEIVCAHSSRLASQMRSYVDRYGDRVIGELKLETPSAREDPSFLGEVLVGYLNQPGIDPDMLERTERESARRAELALCAAVRPWQRPIVRRELSFARRGIAARERLRLRRTVGFGYVRDFYNVVGHRLHEAGILAHPRDVFYLTAGEVEGFLTGSSVSVGLGALAALREAEFRTYLDRETPDRMRTVGSPYLSARYLDDEADGEALPEDGRLLRGLGCCAGVVEARVRLVIDPQTVTSLDGDVLCTVRTDPGWTPLFPTAGALVIERGSTLSHSAVVARELGIPTVVGVPQVTRILTDGERVRVDGTTGEILRLDHEADVAR